MKFNGGTVKHIPYITRKVTKAQQMKKKVLVKKIGSAIGALVHWRAQSEVGSQRNRRLVGFKDKLGRKCLITGTEGAPPLFIGYLEQIGENTRCKEMRNMEKFFFLFLFDF